MLPELLTLNEAVGRNVRRIRVDRGLTLDQLATRARALGLKWNTARVVELEKGKLPVSLQIMMILCQALGAGSTEKIALTDLLWDVNGSIYLTDTRSIEAEMVHRALRGQKVDFRDHAELLQARVDRDRRTPASTIYDRVPAEATLLDVSNAAEGWTLADQRAAKRLGLSKESFLAYCGVLWGMSLSDRRNNDAADEMYAMTERDANATLPAQRLGAITRRRVEELRERVVADG